ncbi:hypothetical protein P7C70_g7608, partial [Phenoliferia sp. Uapishka_3]
MFARAPVETVSDEELVAWNLRKDLVAIRSGPTSYGTVLIGKLRLPAINDDEGEGFVHVRVHDPPSRGQEDVTFHSIFTDEVREGEKIVDWRAIQREGKALEFFMRLGAEGSTDSDRDGSSSPPQTPFASTPSSDIDSLNSNYLSSSSYLAESYFSGLPLLNSVLPAYFPLPMPLDSPAALLSSESFLSPEFDYYSYLSPPSTFSPSYSFDPTPLVASIPPITTPPESPENQLFAFDNQAFAIQGKPAEKIEGLFEDGATSEWDFDGLYGNGGWMALGTPAAPVTFGMGEQNQYEHESFWGV